MKKLEKFLLVVNASNIDKDLAWIKKQNSFGCHINNQSENYSLLAVQGPDSIKLLQELTQVHLNNIKYYHFEIGSIANINKVIISRTGYTGEIGFELYVKNQYVKKLWDALFSTPIEIKPIGLAARDTLRLEKGFCLYGNDINETTSPVEAGLGWITKFSKTFTNSENLQKQSKEGVKQKLIGFELLERGIPRKGYEIIDTNELTIGEVTSGTMSPFLGKGIGMGYLKTNHTAVGTPIGVKIRKKIVAAVVVKTPFYKP